MAGYERFQTYQPGDILGFYEGSPPDSEPFTTARVDDFHEPGTPYDQPLHWHIAVICPDTGIELPYALLDKTGSLFIKHVPTEILIAEEHNLSCDPLDRLVPRFSIPELKLGVARLVARTSLIKPLPDSALE